MATTKFNSILMDVATRLKSPRAYATYDVDLNGNASVYTSALLTKHINRAIRDLLKEKYESMGDAVFMESFPEYVRTSGVLTLAAGVVAKPVDAFMVVGMSVSTYAVKFDHVKQTIVDDIRTGREKQIVPSATRPVFWDESGVINSLGLLAGNVVMKYIVTHQDIVPVISSGTGNWLTGSDGAWTAATRLLAGTMHASFATTDVNKRVMFRNSTNTYEGRIESRGSNTTVVLIGDNLPAGNITTGSVLAIMVSDTDSDSSDLKINSNYHAEIINKAVEYALMDAKAAVIQ
jgi:hypothetical protein